MFYFKNMNKSIAVSPLKSIFITPSNHTELGLNDVSKSAVAKADIVSSDSGILLAGCLNYGQMFDMCCTLVNVKPSCNLLDKLIQLGRKRFNKTVHNVFFFP